MQTANKRKEWNARNRHYYFEYRRTFDAYYMILYQLLRSRCTKDKAGQHPQYVGLSFMDVKEWKSLLGVTMPLRKILHQIWAESGFQRRLAPTVDRIDLSKGYIRGNVRFVPQYHNSAKIKPYTQMSNKFL